MTPRGSMSASADSRPPLQDLSPQLKMMFPRTPVIDKAVPIKRRAGIETKYTGLAALLSEFENTPPPKSTPVKNLEKEQEKRRRKAHRRNKKKVAAQMATYDPLNNTAATGNAFQTLFIARLSPNTTQESLQKMLEQYGPLRSVIIVSDRKGKSRRYAFAEFEYEDDMTEVSTLLLLLLHYSLIATTTAFFKHMYTTSASCSFYSYTHHFPSPFSSLSYLTIPHHHRHIVNATTQY